MTRSGYYPRGAQRSAIAKARRARQRRRDRWFVLFIVLWCLAVAAVSIWIDLSWFLVGGSHQAVEGAHANNTDQMTFGRIRALCSGVACVVGFVVAIVGSKWIADQA